MDTEQLLFASMFTCNSAVWKLGRNQKFKSKVVFFVLINTTTTVFRESNPVEFPGQQNQDFHLFDLLHQTWRKIFYKLAKVPGVPREKNWFLKVKKYNFLAYVTPRVPPWVPLKNSANWSSRFASHS